MKPEFEPELDFELALCLTPGLGSGGIARILARNAVAGISPSKFLSLSPEALREEYGLRSRAAQALARGAVELRPAIRSFKERVQGKPVELVTCESPIYPRRIEEFCERPPAFLTLYGNLKVLGNRTFCALASRNATEVDLDRLEKAVEEGVLKSLSLVTGANTQAYRRAAVVPLRWGAPRVLVLDRGLFQTLGDDLSREPFRAARLWRYKFDPVTDLAVSCFRPDDAYAPGNNKRRDELVVALSDDVRVVHVAKGGNTDLLSTRAEGLGRRVARLF